MYKRGRGSFYKHLDFLIADMLVLQVTFAVSYCIRHGFIWMYANEIYRQMSVVLLLIQMCVVVITKSYKGIIRRDKAAEFVQVVQYVSLIILLAFAYMFAVKVSVLFSRTVFVLTWGLAVFAIYFERLFWKKLVKERLMRRKSLRAVIVAGEEEKVLRIVRKSLKNEYKDYRICGLIITDKDLSGGKIEGVDVIGHDDLPHQFMVDNVVDEILLYYGESSANIRQIRDTSVNMGLTIHKVIAETPPVSQRTVVEEFSGYTVLTTSINMASARQLFCKRLMDIVGGLAGVAVTGILAVFLGPLIYIKSPGPIFFSQERIGKNGRRFKVYKFRSMYLDAEERKRELMGQNEVDGLMFKMEDDPRVIKGIGTFMRRTSLDEFPQFWNVLKNDMSLVGTRPPTVDEYEQYDAHHKKRMTIKPGITGLWQVSGRSDITDFEEVVALDTQYITEWSIGMDIRILFKTILVVLKNDGAK